MKKFCKYLLCFSFIFILMGCAGSKIEKQSENIIHYIQDHDFEKVMALGNDDLKANFNAEQLEDLWLQTSEGLGELIKIEQHIVDEGEKQMTDLVIVSYKNGTLRFTFTYDSNHNLANIYIK